MHEQPPTYDHEAIYDREIAPLMDQIIAICRRAQIPMVASFCYANSPERASFCFSALSGPHDWTPKRYDAIRIVHMADHTEVVEVSRTHKRPSAA